MNQSQEESESWKYGIKLQFLLDWSKQQSFTPTITTREVCENFIKPATQATQLSYCEQLLLSADTAEFVGFPTAFISHAWDDHFPEVLEALYSYFTAEPDVVIWFDIFCNNQHKTASFQFGWWCDGFKNAIHSFGRTVMVLAPWNDPSPASIEQFIADVDADPGSVLYKMLATIDTSKSECYKEDDKQRIHDAIRRTVGFNELNKEIFQVMRGWVTSKYEERYKTIEAPGDHATLSAMNNLAILYDNQGEYEKALPLYEECLRQNTVTFGQQHPVTLHSMNNLACLYDDQGQFTKALPLYKKCFRMRKDVLGDSHPDTLHSMNNLACLFLSKGKLGKALPLHEECLSIRKVVLGEKHLDTLSSMNNLSRLYYEQGDYEKALPLCKESLRLRKTILGENHADTLTSMNNLGILYMGQGEYEKALPLYEECLRQSIVEFGENHPGTLAFMKNLENCQKLSCPSTVTS